jgi:hypothetical protein
MAEGVTGRSPSGADGAVHSSPSRAAVVVRPALVGRAAMTWSFLISVAATRTWLACGACGALWHDYGSGRRELEICRLVEDGASHAWVMR